MVYHNVQKFPRDSGAGVIRETVDSTKFDDICETLMQEIGWAGVVEIDFLWDEKESSTPQMIEVNPRFWAALDHAITSGIDFPWLLFQLFAYSKEDFDGTDRRKEVLKIETE